MNSMITEVLNYSKIGRSEIKHQRIDSGLMIDDLRVAQLLSNHLGNAITHAEKVKSIQVTMNDTSGYSP